MKAFHYNAEIREESIPAVQAVIDDFNLNALVDLQAVRYIAKNAMKMIRNARDLERVWNELDRNGLRKKLIEFAKECHITDLQIFLEKEPLRSAPLGTLPWITDAYPKYRPSGQTAAELGIDMVSHETKNDFLTYESITMSRTGKANLFLSRSGMPGERAHYGVGAYMRRGRVGEAIGRGLTIRYLVDPHAIEGRDFFVVGDYVVFRNGSALKTLAEGQSAISFRQMFDILRGNEFRQEDLGVIKKLELKTRSAQIENPAEAREVGEWILNEMQANSKKFKIDTALSAYLKLAVDREMKAKMIELIIANPKIKKGKKLRLILDAGFEDRLFTHESDPVIRDLILGGMKEVSTFRQFVDYYGMAAVAGVILARKDLDPQIRAEVLKRVLFKIRLTYGCGDERKAMHALIPALNISLEHQTSMTPEVARWALNPKNPEHERWTTLPIVKEKKDLSIKNMPRLLCDWLLNRLI